MLAPLSNYFFGGGGPGPHTNTHTLASPLPTPMVCAYFSFGFKGGMLDLIDIAPDLCFSLYLYFMNSKSVFATLVYWLLKLKQLFFIRNSFFFK